MNRLPASGMVIVIGPPSRSNTPDEYSVSRFARTTGCLSTWTTSRRCNSFPRPPASFADEAMSRDLMATTKRRSARVTCWSGSARDLIACLNFLDVLDVGRIEQLRSINDKRKLSLRVDYGLNAIGLLTIPFRAGQQIAASAVA